MLLIYNKATLLVIEILLKPLTKSKAKSKAKSKIKHINEKIKEVAKENNILYFKNAQKKGYNLEET